MKIRFFAFLILFSAAYRVSGQEVILEQDVWQNTEPQNWGPNLKHFIYPFTGYGFVAGAAETAGSQVKYGASHDWHLGLRYKLKLAELYAVGLDLHVNPQTFYLKQHAGKTLPNSLQHESEKLRITNVGLGFYNRINFRKRGNYLGNFTDLGVFGNWLASSTHIARDQVESNGEPAGEEIIVKSNNLNYLTDFHYGLLARIGFNRFVFYGTYRLSNLFNNRQGKNFAELPKMVIGFELGLHQ